MVNWSRTILASYSPQTFAHLAFCNKARILNNWREVAGFSDRKYVPNLVNRRPKTLSTWHMSAPLWCLKPYLSCTRTFIPSKISNVITIIILQYYLIHEFFPTMTFESTWNPNNYIPAKALGLTQSMSRLTASSVVGWRGEAIRNPACDIQWHRVRTRRTHRPGSPDAFFNDVFE